MIDMKKMYEDALHFNKQCNLADIDNIVQCICESSEIDEDIKTTVKSVWNKLRNWLTTPKDCITKVLDQDRALIAQTEKNLKMLPKEDLGAIYSVEFADANIVEDIRDMIAMLKDVMLLRYKHVPWRIAMSACILLAYILYPGNITAGTAFKHFIEMTLKGTTKAAAAVGWLGGSGIAGNTIGLTTMFSNKKVDVGQAWSDAIKQISNGDFTPEFTKAIEPYLNCLDELCLVYLLWKWHKKDLKSYRLWKAAKIKAKQQLHLDCDINEDAVMAAGAGDAGAGEIAAPSPAADSDIVKGGTTTDDVLGKDCDHHKNGYLGPGCFHVPSRTCKMFKREILAGKKKKKQKNDYAKGMTIIGEGPILHQYKGRAKQTADKIKSCINDDIYLDKLYFIEQFGFACRLNSKGYFHIYRPVKVTLDGAFSHYSIKHMMLTDKNELKELSMFGDFKTKDDALKEIEKTAKQGQ